MMRNATITPDLEQPDEHSPHARELRLLFHQGEAARMLLSAPFGVCDHKRLGQANGARERSIFVFCRIKTVVVFLGHSSSRSFCYLIQLT
jgi:hypothetical protein